MNTQYKYMKNETHITSFYFKKNYLEIILLKLINLIFN